jgi:hypothetical protein
MVKFLELVLETDEDIACPVTRNMAISSIHFFFSCVRSALPLSFGLPWPFPLALSLAFSQPTLALVCL